MIVRDIHNGAHVRDTATYDDPRRLPEGIPYVIVNGAKMPHSCEGYKAARREGTLT